MSVTSPDSSHATCTVQITLKDGTVASHTAEALRYWLESDGAVVVEAACCGEDATRSRHTFYDIGRDTAAGPVDPEAEVRAHVQRVAEHHAAVHRAKSFTLDRLMKPSAP